MSNKTTRCMVGRAYWHLDGRDVKVVHSSDGTGYLYTFASSSEAKAVFDFVGNYQTWGPAGFSEWPFTPVKWVTVGR
jgi:hypothetical protein